MKNSMVFYGVDISKSTLDIVGLDARDQIVYPAHQIKQTPSRIRKFFRELQALQQETPFSVGFEHTGVYGFHLRTILAELQIPFYAISPLAIYRSKGLQRGKSDQKDAVMTARYLRSNHHHLEPGSLPKESLIKIKLLYTQREKIIKSLKLFQSTQESYDYLPKHLQKELRQTNTSIEKNLQKNLSKIEEHIENLIRQDENLNTKHQLIQSVPGVGPQTSIYLLIVTQGFTTFKDARKLACFTGIAPFPYQSGSSIRGRTKVHPLANKKLKSLIHMCALTAKKYDHELKAYYDRKVGEGKNKMLVLNNIRNKVLHRVFAVVERGKPYVNTHRFAS